MSSDFCRKATQQLKQQQELNHHTNNNNSNTTTGGDYTIESLLASQAASASSQLGAGNVNEVPTLTVVGQVGAVMIIWREIRSLYCIQSLVLCV
jgi:hypothetical protein